MKSNLIEIEVDEATNGGLHFLPLGKKLRGRFDAARALKTDAAAGELMRKWPAPIPGQRLGIDLDAGLGYVVEPLHEPEHAGIRAKIEEKKQKLEPERQTFSGVDAATWLFWIKRAVEGGSARLVKGQLPDTIEGEPQTSFVVRREKDPQVRLAEAIERQTDTMNKLLTALLKRA